MPRDQRRIYTATIYLCIIRLFYIYINSNLYKFLYIYICVLVIITRNNNKKKKKKQVNLQTKDRAHKRSLTYSFILNMKRILFVSIDSAALIE